MCTAHPAQVSDASLGSVGAPRIKAGKVGYLRGEMT